LFGQIVDSSLYCLLFDQTILQFLYFRLDLKKKNYVGNVCLSHA
jgi:hypothetical protein